MDHNIINEYNELLINDKVTFWERNKKLSNIGIERYIVDLVGLRTLYFSIKGETYIANIILPVTTIPEILNLIEVSSIIKNAKQQKINYLTLLLSLMQAGCSHYEVFLNNGKAFYFGRNGEQYIDDVNLST